MSVETGPFVRYATERQGATEARRAGRPRPWATDPIIAGKKFCSVRRDDDRGSVEARSLILSLPEDLRLRAVLGYRLYNRPETLQVIIDRGLLEKRGISDHQLFRQAFQDIADKGDPVLSAAYKIQVAGGLKNLDTIAKMVHKGVRAAAGGEFELRRHSAMYTCHGIRGAVGSGAFVCYQTMQDLIWLQEPGFRYGDQDSWALIGIGAIRGLARILGVYGPDQKWVWQSSMDGSEFRRRVALLDRLTVLRKTSAMEPMPEAAAAVWGELLAACREAGLTFMDAFEVEHNLCEFDKYERIRTGEGKGVSFSPRGEGGEAAGDTQLLARAERVGGRGPRPGGDSTPHPGERDLASGLQYPSAGGMGQLLPQLDQDSDEWVA